MATNARRHITEHANGTSADVPFACFSRMPGLVADEARATAAATRRWIVVAIGADRETRLAELGAKRVDAAQVRAALIVPHARSKPVLQAIQAGFSSGVEIRAADVWVTTVGVGHADLRIDAGRHA